MQSVEESSAREIPSSAVVQDPTHAPGSRASSYVFLDVEQSHHTSMVKGRLVFQLFDDVAPLTARNFRELCTGGSIKTSRSRGAQDEALRDALAHKMRQEVKATELSFEGSSLFRVVQGEAVYGGDIKAGNGIAGGCSVYGGGFQDENYTVPHSTFGVLAMAPSKNGENTSLFQINLRPRPELDGKCVAFGQLISGKDLLRTIEDVEVVGGTAAMPLDPVRVIRCGVVTMVRDGEEARTVKKQHQHDRAELKRKQRAEENKPRLAAAMESVVEAMSQQASARAAVKGAMAEGLRKKPKKKRKKTEEKTDSKHAIEGLKASLGL